MHFSYTTHLPGHEVADVFAWHERPGALERLTPPWGDVVVEHKEGGIRDGARVVLRIKQGPASFRWDLRHRDYEKNRQFRDEQVSGPLKSWVHTHRFSSDGAGGCIVEDEIDLEPPLGPAGAALAPGFIETELKRLFEFRHVRLRHDLSLHQRYAGSEPLTVAISGASGLIGSNLRHLLTTGGHTVRRMVRREEDLEPGDILWDARNGSIDAAALEGVDAVVHLAGEPIAGGRWTDARKKAIYRSRVDGTELIARTLAEMNRGPRVLVSMSAVGYYGDRGNERLDESSSSGKGFLAKVTQDWEAATRPAERAGIRVVRLRGGVVLSPAGGALGKMLLPFKMGVGGRLGSGKQYVSWVDLDDLVGLIYHALRTDSVHGALNGTGPNPVTNATFTSILGDVLGRPTFIPVPALAVKAAFGELGEEALLQGQRVLPVKAERTGFEFLFDGVEASLRFQLGRQKR